MSKRTLEYSTGKPNPARRRVERREWGVFILLGVAAVFATIAFLCAIGNKANGGSGLGGMIVIVLGVPAELISLVSSLAAIRASRWPFMWWRAYWRRRVIVIAWLLILVPAIGFFVV